MDNKELPALEHPKILPLFYNRENGVYSFSGLFTRELFKICVF